MMARTAGADNEEHTTKETANRDTVREFGKLGSKINGELIETALDAMMARTGGADNNGEIIMARPGGSTEIKHVPPARHLTTSHLYFYFTRRKNMTATQMELYKENLQQTD